MGGFDYLRLIAAILVVAHHARVLSGQPPLMLGPDLDPGALGVGMFFVISGYLVTDSLRRSASVATFLARRALRVFPGLLVMLLLTVLVLGPLVTTIDRADYLGHPDTWQYVIGNLSLYGVAYDLPGVFLTVPLAGIVNGSLWTLRLEFTAYLGLALLEPLRRALPLALESLTAVAAVAAVALHAPGLDAQGDLFRIAYLAALNGFLFLAGAVMQTHGARPGGLAAITPLLFLATPAWFLALPLPVVWLGQRRLPRLPADLSYGLYIYSFPLQQWLVEQQQLSLPASLLLTLPFAAASWFLVEKPALALKTQLASPASPAAAATG